MYFHSLSNVYWNTYKHTVGTIFIPVVNESHHILVYDFGGLAMGTKLQVVVMNELKNGEHIYLSADAVVKGGFRLALLSGSILRRPRVETEYMVVLVVGLGL